jgi:hypothetical protein
MEQIAQPAAEGLTEGTLQTCLEQQAQTLGPQQPCPACGRPCPTRRQTRPLAVRGGATRAERAGRLLSRVPSGLFPPNGPCCTRRPRLSPGRQGRVAEVVEELEKQQAALGRPPPGEELAANDPRRVVAEALSYLGNNAERMNDPEYRRQGLPTTSSLVESRVGEFNARVKGKEKFWNRPGGAEAILQVRAALLSEDGRLPRHFASRLGSLLESIRNLRQLFSWVSVQ